MAENPQESVLPDILGTDKMKIEEENGVGTAILNDQQDEEERVPKVSIMGHARDGPKKRSSDVQVQGKHENVDFSDMQLSEDILKGLKLCRYDKPTPIQLSAIPLGKLNYDLLLQAKSGTGKTCVFTVCVLQEIDVTKKCIQALVMSPCREIAVQIAYVMKSIGAFKDGLKVKEFIGGTSVAQSIRRLTNCHVAIGTPGRLAHMVKDYNMDLSHVRVVALDEADKLMEPSFFQDVQVMFNVLPVEKQMITTSATYTENVLDFLEKFMRSPCRVQLDLSNPALTAVDQYLVDVKKTMGGTGTAETDEAFRVKFNCLREILKRLQFTQAIIFSNWQLRAEKLYDELKDLDVDVVLLSAARCQEDRLEAFTQLQQGKCKMMVATDVASRGIDVEGIDLVINFDVPQDSDTYIHRIGRTGRFGASGKALSLCSFESERRLMSEFQIEINFTMWVVENLEELSKINDHSQKVQTFRQLKGIIEPVTTQDADNQNWNEHFETCMKITIENDGLENYVWSGFKTDLEDHEIASAAIESRTVYEKAKAAQALQRQAIMGLMEKDEDVKEDVYSGDEEDSDEDDSSSFFEEDSTSDNEDDLDDENENSTQDNVAKA